MVFLKRYLKRLAWLLLALIVLYAVGRPIQIWLGGLYSGVREPYLQMMSTNSVNVRWQSEHEYSAVLRYGVRPFHLNKVQNETSVDVKHEIRLTGLKANTKYFYSLGDGNKEVYSGKNFWFKTAPLVTTNKPENVRFWVTGDQGYPNIIQNQVRDAMFTWVKKNPRPNKAAPKLDLWLTTGDNAYRSGTNQQFQKGFFEPYKNILRNTPVWPVYGNHDARRRAFFDIFTFPTNAESGGVASDTEHYYSFDYSNIHFVMLDTQDSDHDIDGEMLKWLKTDLQKTKQQWLIAFFHHPPYTKGSHDSDDQWDSAGRLTSVRENILPLLEKSGVDLVFSGHSHMYERSELMNCHYGESATFTKSMNRASTKSRYKKKGLNISKNSGTIYTVIGSSSKVDAGPLDHPALPYAYQQAGSMIFDVDQNKLNAFFINNESKVLDQFEIIKGVNNGVKEQLCTER